MSLLAPPLLQGRSAFTSPARVVANTLWTGIDSLAGLFVAVLTSILLARTFGPEKMGNYNLLIWASSLSCTLGSLSIPTVTRKYMAEYFSLGEGGVVRAVFFFTLSIQTCLALGIGGLGIAISWAVCGPEQRPVSVILFASIIPQMVSYIPSQANTAMERFARNNPGSWSGMLVYLGSVLLSVSFGWSLAGVACGIAASQTVEAAIKLAGVLRHMRTLPKVHLPAHLRKRMWGFSKHNLVLAPLNIIVFERSDVLLLKFLHPDHRQIAYFSIPFSLVEKALILPRALAVAVGASVMAEYGRNLERTRKIAEVAFRYISLSGLPMLAGIAAISTPLVEMFYGPAYYPAANALAVLALFGISKCLMGPAQALCMANEDLSTLLRLTLLSGVVNAFLDLLLIPSHGALGAAAGAGIAQTVAACLLWKHVSRVFKLSLEVTFMWKLVLSVATMSAAVIPLTLLLTPRLALLLGPTVGAAVFVLMMRFTSVVSIQDRSCLTNASSSVPAIKIVADWIISLVSAPRPVR